MYICIYMWFEWKCPTSCLNAFFYFNGKCIITCWRNTHNHFLYNQNYLCWLGMVVQVFNPGTWEAEAGLVNLCSQGYIERPFLENYKANQKNCLFFLFIPFELKPLGELGPSDYRVMSWFCLPYVPGDPPVSASWLTVAACHTHRIALVILGSNSGHQVSMASACFYILRYLLSSGSCFQFFHCGIKYT